jgi:GT2 family glycosyltransferase
LSDAAARAPLFSTVVVNYRTEAYLARALESVAAQEPPSQIVLVNNGSPGLPPDALAKYPALTVIANERNVGFARANNQGIAAARGRYVCVLNADAYLSPGFFAEVVRAFDAHPEVGWIAPKILRAGDPSVIDAAGHVFYRDRTAANRGAGERDTKQYDTQEYVFGATAACALYRRDMLDALAVDGEVFDSDFFAYYEDVDLDWHANLQGFRCLYLPTAVAYHVGAGSGARAGRALLVEAEKNRYLMMAKNDRLSSQVAAFLPLLVYELYHAAHVVAHPYLLSAAPRFFALLPRALRKRRVIQSRAKARVAFAGRMYVRQSSLRDERGAR